MNCRKGENDPLISLRSRKARITGDWILKEGSLEKKFISNSSTFLKTTTFTSDTKTINDNGNVTKSGFTQRFTVRKDNSFERETIDGNNKTTHFGSWSFVNKNKDQDIKNKEAIILSIESYTINGVTTVNEGVFVSEFLKINRLSNKELIFKGNSKRNFTSGEKEEESYEYKFEKI